MSNVDDLYSMSDDDLEAAFRSAKAEQAEFGDNDEQDHNVDENLTDVDENVNPNDEINSEAEDEVHDNHRRNRRRKGADMLSVHAEHDRQEHELDDNRQ